MTPSDSIRFIVNPNAGFRRDKRAIIDLIKLHCNTRDFEIKLTTGPGHATVLASEAASLDYGIVVAVGGDGTVNEVATGLVGTETALGIIPRGSGNGLARSLGIPIHPLSSTLRVLRDGVVRRIDVGCAGERYFFVVTGIGFDASVGLKFNSTTRRGPLPYFLIAAREFASYQPETLTINYDEHSLEFSPFLLTIANTQQYGNGAIIAPHAKPDDGLLDLCIVEPMSLLTAVVHVGRLFTGTIDRAPMISYRRAKEFEIIKPGVILYHVDGEALYGKESLKISVKPGALKVITPPPRQPFHFFSHANRSRLAGLRQVPRAWKSQNTIGRHHRR